MIELSKTSDSDFLKMPRSNLTGDSKWADIEDLINRWAKRRPERARALEGYIKDTQTGLFNAKFGKSKAEGMGRIGIAIDPELLEYIKTFYPDFMDTKEDMHRFMNKFPKFRVPEKT